MNRLLLLLLALLVFLSPLVYSQGIPSSQQVVATAADSLMEQNENPSSTGEDIYYSSVFLFVIVSILLINFFVLFLGVIVSIGLLFLAFIFITTGILSISAMVALRNQSLASGFRLFLVLITGFFGACTGVAAMAAAKALFHLHHSLSSVVCSGAIGGLAGGIFLGYVMVWILRRFFEIIKTRLN